MTLKEFKEKFGNLPDNTQIFGVNANGDLVLLSIFYDEAGKQILISLD